jgi:hypothetical protein
LREIKKNHAGGGDDEKWDTHERDKNAHKISANNSEGKMSLGILIIDGIIIKYKAVPALN